MGTQLIKLRLYIHHRQDTGIYASIDGAPEGWQLLTFNFLGEIEADDLREGKQHPAEGLGWHIVEIQEWFAERQNFT